MPFSSHHNSIVALLCCLPQVEAVASHVILVHLHGLLGTSLRLLRIKDPAGFLVMRLDRMPFRAKEYIPSPA